MTTTKKKKEEGVLDLASQDALQKQFMKDRANRVLSSALSRTALSTVSFVPASVKDVNPAFSVEVKTMSVTNQRASGRCWIFAGLNFLREIIAKKLNLSNFELSQNYISLFDKIEKANFALESVLSLADRPNDDRVLAFILNDPVSDGGQWDMLVNLVEKYGLLPKSAFPETYQSENTRETDFMCNCRIRAFAALAHKLVKEGKLKEAREEKEKAMKDIYNMFIAAFGIPPKTFDFAYTDKKDKYHVEMGLTPLEFKKKYIGKEMSLYQSLINSPTADKPYNKNFTIDYLGNVIEGKRINHLNVTMKRMKEAIIAQLKGGFPVWFGSDVSFYRDRDSFAWDDNAYDYVSGLNFKPDFDKGDMLDFKASAMNHAMLIVGVDLVDGKPTRWKIENSWGKTGGLDGYYVMSDSWFEKFVYQAVVKKDLLTEKEMAATKKEPTHLPPWDPMGTLAD